MSSHESSVLGGGKVTGRSPHGRDGWEPLETGEFLLGYKDEALEEPEAPSPELLSRNGTFLVYRKLHQNVGSFDRYLNEIGKDFPGGKESLAAKFAGRWRNGAPITTFPTEKEADDFSARGLRAKEAILAAPDPAASSLRGQATRPTSTPSSPRSITRTTGGGRCPVGAHIRRANPRGLWSSGRRARSSRRAPSRTGAVSCDAAYPTATPAKSASTAGITA